MDVENGYFVKDGLLEYQMEEFVVEFGEYDGCSRDNEEELIDDKDRRLIDNALLYRTTDSAKQANGWVYFSHKT